MTTHDEKAMFLKGAALSIFAWLVLAALIAMLFESPSCQRAKITCAGDRSFFLNRCAQHRPLTECVGDFKLLRPDCSEESK